MQNDNQISSRDEIKRKLREQFDGKIVRKDLTKKLKEGANVPTSIAVLMMKKSFKTVLKKLRKS